MTKKTKLDHPIEWYAGRLIIEYVSSRSPFLTIEDILKSESRIKELTSRVRKNKIEKKVWGWIWKHCNSLFVDTLPACEP